MVQMNAITLAAL